MQRLVRRNHRLVVVRVHDVGRVVSLLDRELFRMHGAVEDVGVNFRPVGQFHAEAQLCFEWSLVAWSSEFPKAIRR